MSEAFRKISDKEYEIQIEGRTKSIFVPFGKVKALVKEFAGQGGMIDAATGLVKTDLLTLVDQFGNLGTILLSEFDEKGKLKEEISCEGLAYTDVVNVFRLVQDIIGNFIQVALADQNEKATENQPSQDTKEKKTRKEKI